MCGIAGFVGPRDPGAMDAMLAPLRARGPDDRRTEFVPELGINLGHLRLAVVDLEHGAQPMWTADGATGVVYNGELYNAPELRHQLERRGRRFRTSHSDTEVLLHGYEEWGEELPVRLNGMFAFAIIDRRRRRVMLARDRFGEKPLFYASGSGHFVFASELDAVTAHPAVGRSIDDASVVKYLAYGYVPAPRTLYRGVRKLPGGASLVVDVDSLALRERTYWRFRIEPETEHGDEGALAEELRGLLDRATERRMVSDVPLGVFLSGGIDSSAVAASAVRVRGGAPVETFTIGFEERSYDESRHARTVAEHLGTQHHERRLDLAVAERLMPSVLGAMDEPIADPSLVPTALLAAFARERVTVALSGDGGDELFAGYDPMVALAPARLLRRIAPRPLIDLALRGTRLLPRSDDNMPVRFRAERFLWGLRHPESMQLPVWMAPARPHELADLLAAPVDPSVVYSEAIEAWESGQGGTVERSLEFFTRFYLQEDILVKVDRAAMRSSLESRAVFLDNDVVDFARRLPTAHKIGARGRKLLLRAAMRERLPASVVDRPKKGFGIPASAWLRHLTPQREVQGLPVEAWPRVSGRWDQHRAGAIDHRLLLWALLALDAAVRPDVVRGRA